MTGVQTCALPISSATDPGAAFTPVEGTHSTLRLAYSFVEAEKLVEGVRRLAPAVNESIARDR